MKFFLLPEISLFFNFTEYSVDADGILSLEVPEADHLPQTQTLHLLVNYVLQYLYIVPLFLIS